MSTSHPCRDELALGYRDQEFWGETRAGNTDFGSNWLWAWIRLPKESEAREDKGSV